MQTYLNFLFYSMVSCNFNSSRSIATNANRELAFPAYFSFWLVSQFEVVFNPTFKNTFHIIYNDKNSLFVVVFVTFWKTFSATSIMSSIFFGDLLVLYGVEKSQIQYIEVEAIKWLVTKIDVPTISLSLVMDTLVFKIDQMWFNIIMLNNHRFHYDRPFLFYYW